MMTKTRESPTFVNMGLNGQMPLRLDPSTKAAVKALAELAYARPQPGDREARRPSFSSFAGELFALGLTWLRSQAPGRRQRNGDLAGHRWDEAKGVRRGIAAAADYEDLRCPEPNNTDWGNYVLLIGCREFRKQRGLPPAATATPTAGRRRHVAASSDDDD